MEQNLNRVDVKDDISCIHLTKVVSALRLPPWWGGRSRWPRGRRRRRRAPATGTAWSTPSPEREDHQIGLGRHSPIHPKAPVAPASQLVGSRHYPLTPHVVTEERTNSSSGGKFSWRMVSVSISPLRRDNMYPQRTERRDSDSRRPWPPSPGRAERWARKRETSEREERSYSQEHILRRHQWYYVYLHKVQI